MNWSDIEQLDTAHLARLLDLNIAIRWDRSDKENGLRSQLAAPLCPDLLCTQGIDTQELEAFFNTYSGPATFVSQLLSDEPSLTLLTAIKLFAKQQGADPSIPISREGS